MIPALLRIGGSVTARLGPWLRRLGGDAVNRALSAVRAAGIAGINTLDDLVKYATASPSQAFVVLSTLASAGFAVSDLFGPGDKQDPDEREAYYAITKVESQAFMKSINGAAQQSESLKGLGGPHSDVKALREICVWARGHYGSANQMRTAHAMNQAFFELSAEDVDRAIDLFNL